MSENRFDFGFMSHTANDKIHNKCSKMFWQKNSHHIFNLHVKESSSMLYEIVTK